MTIARRLLLLVAVPLLILGGLGLFIHRQLESIETRTRFVAESQIGSLAALGNITRSFTEMRVNVRNALLTDDPAELARARAAFDEDRAEVERLLRHYADTLVTDDRDRRLLNEYRDSSAAWATGAEEVFSLAAAGRRGEADALLNGPLMEISLRLSKVSKEWIAYNEGLATSSGEAAVSTIEESRRNLLLAIAAALLLAAALGILTFRRIARPIHALDNRVRTIAGGDYAQAVPSTESTDEIGGLARSIEVLKQGAASMEEQRWVKTSAATLTGALQGAASLAEFGERFLSGLVPMLGGGVAGFYLAESEPERLRRIAGYGLAKIDGAGEGVAPGEGLVGQCARDRAPVALTDVPAGFLPISSGLGRSAPSRVAAWPLISQGALLGVVELASFRALNSAEQALLEELLPVASMSLAILQRNLATQSLLARTQEQAEELSEQKESLRHQHFLADSALDLTKSGYWHVPLDGSGWYNSSERAARIFGDLPSPGHRYTLDHWAAHVREGDEAAAIVTAENFAAAVAGTIPVYDAVYAYKRPIDGRVVWIHALGHVVKDDGGKPSDMYGVTQDITDFKLLETELIEARDIAEAASRAKADFLANMSHEIRTPMNAVLGLTRLALKTDLSPKQRDYLNKVHISAQSLLGIINDILDFSKIEAGKLDMERIPFDLESVLDNLATLVTVKAQEKEGIEVLFRRSAEVPSRADRRPAPARTGAGQPGEQRDQVHRPGRDRGVDRARSPRRVHHRGRVRRARHRHRHDRGAAGAAVHLLQPGRQLDHPQVRRHRAGAVDQQAAGGDDGRIDPRGEHAGRRQHVPLHRGFRHRPGRRRVATAAAARPPGAEDVGGRRQLELARDSRGNAGVVLVRGHAGGLRPGSAR